MENETLSLVLEDSLLIGIAKEKQERQKIEDLFIFRNEKQLQNNDGDLKINRKGRN